METTTLLLDQVRDQETAERVRKLLDEEKGVARVLVRPDRGEVYIKHSRAKAPRERLLERLSAEGLHAQVKNP